METNAGELQARVKAGCAKGPGVAVLVSRKGHRCDRCPRSGGKKEQRVGCWRTVLAGGSVMALTSCLYVPQLCMGRTYPEKFRGSTQESQLFVWTLVLQAIS